MQIIYYIIVILELIMVPIYIYLDVFKYKGEGKQSYLLRSLICPILIINIVLQNKWHWFNIVMLILFIIELIDNLFGYFNWSDEDDK